MLNINSQISSFQSLKRLVDTLSTSTDEKFNQFEARFEKKYKQIDEVRNQINNLLINEVKQQKKNVIADSMFAQEKQTLEKQIINNKNEIDQIKLSLSKEFTFIKQKINLNSNVIDQMKKEFFAQSIQVTETPATVSQHSEQLKTINNLMNQLKSKIQKTESQLKIVRFFSSTSSQIPSFNEPIRSSKWSSQLKSKAITINGNVVTKTQKTDYYDFCLLDASFTKTLKLKQSWALKTNKYTGGIRLGVCLKSQIQKYNFNGKNISWGEIGHGFYLIGKNGTCHSHSQKEFNHVLKSFEFVEGDLIECEYDPNDHKLIFAKNKVEKFELQMIAPPQDDEYHPCVLFYGQNSSFELLQPPY